MADFSPISRSVIRFGVLALLPVVILGLVLARSLSADIQQRYLDSARSSATLIAEVGIQPNLTREEVISGLSGTGVASMDAELLGASVDKQVRRIKVWNRQGTIVYSDNHDLIGKSFPIDDDLDAALSGHASASITNGNSAENKGDSLSGTFVQVYVPIAFGTGSAPVGAFELYLPYAPVQAEIDKESRQLYLLLAAGLGLFYAAMFPVAVIAERWRRRLQSEAERSSMANLAELQRLNKLKSDFLTRTSHQFRTALVGIQGFSEMMRDTESLDLADVRTFADTIYQDANRLDKAVGEMLELEELEGGHADMKVTRTDVNRLIRDVIDSAVRTRTDRVVKTELADSLPDVACDAGKISEVVSILVDNAINYSPAGSEVTITSRADGDFMNVTVTDQGPGMSGAHVNGASDGGTGLGLSIARQIVELHRGRMWFESDPATGTRFYFTLPLRARATRQMKKVAAS